MRDKGTEGGQPPNTAGGNTTRGETAHRGSPPANIYIAAGTWLGGGPAGVVNRPPLAFRVVCEAVSVVSASHVCIVGEEHAVGENNC